MRLRVFRRGVGEGEGAVVCGVREAGAADATVRGARECVDVDAVEVEVGARGVAATRRGAEVEA